ncbi:MAG: ArnT family glycosyltransferase [Candidatus Nanohaloarchaea archaeon]
MVELPEPEREERLAAAFIALFAAAQLIMISAAWKNPLFWDSAVYTAMGKWIFSSGQYGFWENFRPPVLPLLLGLSWKLGLPEVGFPRLLSAVISTAGLVAVYYGARDLFDRDIALLTVAILAASQTYLRFSLEPLTGIPAAIMIFAGLYMVQDDRPLPGGALLGLAFLTRFPSALGGPAAVGYLALKGYSGGELIEGIRDSALVTLGFFTLAGAYLVVQYHFFGDILSPFQRSVSITAGAGSNYFYGLTYLFKTGLANPLMLLAPLGLYLAARKREWGYGSFAIGFLIFYVFFTSFPLKIERYKLLFLPLMALLSARGLVELRQYLTREDRFVEGVLVLLFLVMAFNASQVYNAYNWEDPQQQRFFSEVSKMEGTVASNDPRVNLYGDFRYRPLPPGELTEVIEQHGSEIDHWAINDRYWDCRGYRKCEQQIEAMEQHLELNYEVTSKIFGGRNNYTIYSER